MRTRVGDVFIKFRYEERDIANAFRARMIATFRKRLEVTLAAVVCIAGGILSFRYAPILVVSLAVAIVALVIATLVVVPKLAFRRRASFRVPMTIDASDDGITVIAGASARTIAWADCARVDVDRRMCVVHHGDEILLVPRRAFRNAGREKAFLDLVDRYASRDKRRFESGKSTPSANQ